MSRLLKIIAVSLSTIAISQFALAHPHGEENSKKSEKEWPNFGTSAESKQDSSEMSLDEFGDMLESRFAAHAANLKESMKDSEANLKLGDRKLRLKFNGEDGSDDMNAALESLEDLFSDNEMITGLTDMMMELSEDFDVEDKDGAKVFMFDGKEMAHFKVDKDRSDRMQIGGLGQNLVIERDTYVKNGQTKTRIVIEMDGGENIDIDLPSVDKDSPEK